MSNAASIGTATFATVTDALKALTNDPAPQIVTLLSAEQGAAAFGTVTPGDQATVIIDGGPTMTDLAALGTFARLSWGKAIIDVESVKDLTIANVVLHDAAAAGDANGAGVRLNGNSKIVRLKNAIIRHNEDGILGGSTELLTIEDSLFDNNGQSSNPSRQGYSHNLYLNGERVELTRTTALYSEWGHDYKSRAKQMIFRQCLADGSKEGRAFDYSNGGMWDSADSAYIKRDGCKQNNLVHLAAETVPDGRPESYVSVNDLFRIDLPDEGRALQFICNDGNVEAVLTDPLFMVGGKVISDADATRFFAGKSPVRIVATGGPRGPRLPYGRARDVLSNTIAEPVAPAPAAPAAPVAIPATPVVAGSWNHVCKEGDTFSVNVGATVRYGTDGAWIVRAISMADLAGPPCATNAFFGGDPCPGIVKVVDVFTAVPVAIAAPAAPIVPAAPAAPAPAAASLPPNRALEAGVAAYLRELGYAVTKA